MRSKTYMSKINLQRGKLTVENRKSNSRWTISKCFQETLGITDRRIWVTSWTLGPHKPLWLLVHTRYDLTFVVRYEMIATGAGTPGEH